MAVPNLKSFCIAVLRPYLRSFFDYFDARISALEEKIIAANVEKYSNGDAFIESIAKDVAEKEATEQKKK